MHTSLHALALNMHVLKRQTCVFSDLILGTAERLISLVTVNDLRPANALSATQTEPLGSQETPPHHRPSVRPSCSTAPITPAITPDLLSGRDCTRPEARLLCDTQQMTS